MVFLIRALCPFFWLFRGLLVNASHILLLESVLQGAEDLTRLAEEDEADEATMIGRTAEEVATIRQELEGPVMALQARHV